MNLLWVGGITTKMCFLLGDRIVMIKSYVDQIDRQLQIITCFSDTVKNKLAI